MIGKIVLLVIVLAEWPEVFADMTRVGPPSMLPCRVQRVHTVVAVEIEWLFVGSLIGLSRSRLLVVDARGTILPQGLPLR
jgi:hypothetical protein